MIPKQILVTTGDIGVDAATVTRDKEEKRAIMSMRDCRVIDTIRQIKEGCAFDKMQDKGRKEQLKKTFRRVKETRL